jgi:hypothetical protein
MMARTASPWSVRSFDAVCVRDCRTRLQFESPLLRSLKTLHNYLQSFDDLQDVDTVMYLQPFLDVIESQDTRCVCGWWCALHTP